MAHDSPTGDRSGFRETPERIDVALAIPVRAGWVLVGRRPPGVHLAGSWEFPGGRIEPGEEPSDAARRELLEETGLRSDSLEPLVLVVHDYADRPLRFHVFLAHDPVGMLRRRPGGEWIWKSPEELRELQMPEANQSMLRALRWRIGLRGRRE
jgi:8-oxo-dGTP diphosphatase